MGKTYRRKDIKNEGFYYSQGETPEDIKHADNIYHSDKPKRWSGISSGVKERQNEIARMEKRKVQNRVMSGGEPMYDKTDKTVKSKANTGWAYS